MLEPGLDEKVLLVKDAPDWGCWHLSWMRKFLSKGVKSSKSSIRTSIGKGVLLKPERSEKDVHDWVSLEKAVRVWAGWECLVEGQPCEVLKPELGNCLNWVMRVSTWGKGGSNYGDRLRSEMGKTIKWVRILEAGFLLLKKIITIIEREKWEKIMWCWFGIEAISVNFWFSVYVYRYRNACKCRGCVCVFHTYSPILFTERVW